MLGFNRWLAIARSSVTWPVRSLQRGGLASVAAVAAALALSIQPALASPSSGCLWSGHSYPPNPYVPNHWYSQIQTTAYTTQGIKGNIALPTNYNVPDGTSNGQQFILSNVQMSEGAPCTNVLGGCWVQIGWINGWYYECPIGGVNAQQTNGFQVYVEIFDDTLNGNNCYEQLYPAPTSIASYDTRYYGTAGSYYRYKAYYEAYNDPNIQVLAYGDFKSQYSISLAGSEVNSPLLPNSSEQTCPTLSGGTSWIDFGKVDNTSNPPLFAGNLYLYGGSWTPWSSTISSASIVDSPYQFQPANNNTANNYIWQQTGGPR